MGNATDRALFQMPLLSTQHATTKATPNRHQHAEEVQLSGALCGLLGPTTLAREHIEGAQARRQAVLLAVGPNSL